MNPLIKELIAARPIEEEVIHLQSARSRTPMVTFTLVFIAILIHLVVTILGSDPVESIPDFPNLPLCIATSFFHGNWEHVLENILVLLIFAPVVESQLGSYRCFLLFLICSAITCVLSVPVYGSPGFGLSDFYNCCLAICIIQKMNFGNPYKGLHGRLFAVFFWISLTGLFGEMLLAFVTSAFPIFNIPLKVSNRSVEQLKRVFEINYTAHYSGALLGLLVALSMQFKKRPRLLASIQTLLVILLLSLSQWAPWSSYWLTKKGDLHYESESYGDALYFYQQSLVLGEDPETAYSNISYAAWHAKDAQKFKTTLKKLRDLNPSLAEEVENYLKQRGTPEKVPVSSSKL